MVERLMTSATHSNGILFTFLNNYKLTSYVYIYRACLHNVSSSKWRLVYIPISLQAKRYVLKFTALTAIVPYIQNGVLFTFKFPATVFP
jgi:hypothetical protein